MQRRESCLGMAFFFAVFTLLAAGVIPATGATQQVLYQFQGGQDGAAPNAVMIADRAGNLYGVTNAGGGSQNCRTGCGTVFELSPPAQSAGSWTETVLYRFQGGQDGAHPQASLIADQAGNLYGTTAAGGNGCVSSLGCGIVFELVRPASTTGAWTEVVLYNFRGVPSGVGNGDLSDPNGIVFDNVGNIYGFAYGGGNCFTDETGTYCGGGAFKLIRPSSSASAWTEKVIYRFNSRGPSGNPAGPIFDKAGNLYGTAPGGAYGFGSVFRLSPPSQQNSAWNEADIYDFQGSDGAFAEPGLAFDSSGNLYGGCLGSPQGSPHGNVFRLSPTTAGPWSETVLYDFAQTTTGYEPNGSPILDATGHVYGTTSGGGQLGFGAVYQLTPPSSSTGAWTESVLYSFTGGSDGAPSVGLNFGLGSALYGVTRTGGNMACVNSAGCGTIFRIVP